MKMLVTEKIQIDPETKASLNSLMESQISTLRSIKSSELAWVTNYLVGIIAISGFFLGSEKKIDDWKFIFIQLIVFFLTIWFFYILAHERSSFYKVLRTLVRIQNCLGLFGNPEEPNQFPILGVHDIDQAYPFGFGINKNKNGTKPYHSFLIRMILIYILYALFLFTSFTQNEIKIDWMCLSLIITFGFGVMFYILDLNSQIKGASLETELLGFDKSWKQ
jgi:hypothetical protein